MASMANPQIQPTASEPHQQQQVHVNNAENAHQQMNQGTTMQYSGQQRKQQMACLYTKQKTQKRKKWQDGRLVLHSMGASLYDAHPPPGSGDPKLDECCLTRAQCDALQQQTETRLETDKYLIQVEGPWIGSTAPTAMAIPNALVSQGMKKVITRKFRKPGTFVPRHPRQEQENQGMRKRQRQPLQPGDLQRRYYGSNAPPQQQRAGPPLGGAPPPAWNQPQQGSRQVNSGPGPVNSQGQRQYPPPQQQFQQQNQIVSGNYNPSPQPPFQQQQEQQQRVSPPFQQGQQPPNMAPNGYNSHSEYSTPNPAPLHQASLHQQQPVQPASRATETNTNAFVGNKFNPNQFYGEDEEEACSQEEEDDGVGGWIMQQQPPQQQASRKPSPNHPAATAPTRNESDTTPMTSQPEQNYTKQAVQPHQQTTTGSGTGSSSALSKNELLKLFGASPYVPVQQTEETSKTGADTQPTQQQPYEFVLPPPDALSDDDSSVESDDDKVAKNG